MVKMKVSQPPKIPLCEVHFHGDKSADRVSMDSDRFVYEKQFNKVMGVDANGNNLYKVRVVVDKNGYLVTSFPQADWK